VVVPPCEKSRSFIGHFSTNLSNFFAPIPASDLDGSRTGVMPW
jgi:hypothetical protein